MKTLDLSGKRITLDELLEIAAMESVRILTADGRAFVLATPKSITFGTGLSS